MLNSVKNLKYLRRLSYIYAWISVLLFSLNIPINKWFLNAGISPIYLTSFLYFGVGIGMVFTFFIQRKKQVIQSIPKRDFPWFTLMGILDILAPILFFSGMVLLQGSTAGFLSNIELLFTIVFALFLFKEKLSFLASIAIMVMLIGFLLLGFSSQGITFTLGFAELLIILASILWGLENNVSRILSVGNPHLLLLVKGLTTGIGALIIAIIFQSPLPSFGWIIGILVVGYVVYGISLNAYVLAQRYLGAAKTQTIQSFSFLLGSLFALLLFKESITHLLGVAFVLVLIAVVILGYDTYTKKA
jgi:drug/metabolite transporter (DMT)-like permease